MDIDIKEMEQNIKDYFENTSEEQIKKDVALIQERMKKEEEECLKCSKFSYDSPPGACLCNLIFSCLSIRGYKLF